MNILDRFSLKGKYALINCPEYPYGKEIAAGLANAGASLYLSGPDEVKLKETAELLASEGTPVSGCFHYEQGTEEAASALSEAVKRELPSLDIYVENSSGRYLKGWNHSFEEIYDSLHFSQLGMMLTVQHLGSIMAEQGHGSVLLISDYAALVGCDPENYKDCADYAPEDFSLDYGYVKGSYVNYARQAAGYLGAHGCRCNCLAYSPLPGNRPEAFEAAFIRHAHLKQMITPEDVAATAVFFASDASRFITGTTLAIDGGYTAK
jgi:NAD(P)-dependent dehydrogenase (short-subunit alcohol dehydrogenase family)